MKPRHPMLPRVAALPVAFVALVSGALVVAGCAQRLTATSTQAGSWEAAYDDARVADGRARSQALGQQLQQRLKSAMQEGGPLQAVAACQVDAPGIAERAGAPGVRVGRTALKVRNPANVADAESARVLRDFERRLAEGEDPAGLESLRSNGSRYRYMKAIVTQPMCETCHGARLAPEVQAAIRERYPNDQATGYVAGSLRGAFIVEWGGG